MSKANRQIEVLDTSVNVARMQDADFISLTDIARHRNKDRSDDLIRNWVRNRNTLEFLGIWERIHNPDFNSVEFDGFRMQAERLKKHNRVAIEQMEFLTSDRNLKRLVSRKNNLN
jgi:hypothetical protein